MSLIQFFKNINKIYLALAVFVVLIALFYGNTLFNGYVQDDIPQIEQNIYLRSLENLPKVVTSCIWEYQNKGCEGRTIYYRPLHYLSYFLTYQISPEPWAFHLVNLLYFLAAAFLVFILAKSLVKNLTIAIVSAVVFIIHPVNSEVVNWVSAASDLLLSIFLLLAVIYYVKYRNTGLIKNFIWVCLFYLFALLSKETAALLPAIIILMDLLFFEKKIKEIVSWREFKKYLIFALPFAAYFIMRTAAIGGGSYFGQFSLSERIYAFFVLFSKYLGKVFYPFPLQAIYDIKIGSSLASPVFFISLFVFLALSALLVFFAKRKQQNFLVFSMVWFLVFLLPPIIFLQAAGAGMSLFLERYLFISSIGFSLFSAFAIVQLGKSRFFAAVRPIALPLLLFLLIVSSLFMVYPRNKAWKNNETLYNTTLAQVPDAHNLRYQLGDFYFKNGEMEKAKIQFEEIIKRDPDWQEITMAYKGLGDYYRAKNDLDNALMSYQKAVETSAPIPRDYVTFNDLGAAFMEKGNFLKGFIYFCQSLLLYPDSQVTQANLDSAISMIDSTHNASGTLYKTTKNEFMVSSQEKIQYLNKQCSQAVCDYEFSLRSDVPELLHPVLISVAGFPNEKDIKIQESSFDPQRNVIVIKIDKKFTGQPLTFFFPTCKGVYHQAIAQ